MPVEGRRSEFVDGTLFRHEADLHIYRPDAAGRLGWCDVGPG
jgi:hypothetical protein